LTSTVEIRERHAERAIPGEDEDAVRVGGQAQLVARAEHAVADDAHLLGALDAAVAGQDRTRQRDWDALAGGDVRGAADDLERLAVPHRDGRERQPIGARVSLHGEQLADDDVLPVAPPAFDALHVDAEQRQALGELFRGELDVDVVAEPGERDPHRSTACAAASETPAASATTTGWAATSLKRYAPRPGSRSIGWVAPAASVQRTRSSCRPAVRGCQTYRQPTQS
jgi:hypothetical protein